MTGKQNRCFLWLTCGVLVICLAGIELPEFLTLTNDTSNDFTTSLISSESSRPAQRNVAGCQQHENVRGPVLRPALACGYFRAAIDPAAQRNPRDLLVLHSSWRT